MPFRIERNDITRISCDAIVNTANPRPVIGDGTDTAIYRAAGEEQLLQARRHIGPLARGQAAATPSFRLKKNGIKYIIHTIGTHYHEKLPETVENLRNCYRNALGVAKDFDCKSVAIPLLATGNYGFPKNLALLVAQEEINDFLEQNEDMLVILAVYDKESYWVSQSIFDEIVSFIDENYVEQRKHEKWEENFEENTSGYIEKPGTKTPYLLQHHAPISKKNAKEEICSILDNELQLSFQQNLRQIIENKEKKASDVYNKAGIIRQTYSKIMKSNSIPSKKNVMALGLALELSLEQYEEFLASAGYSFMYSSKIDLIVKYCVSNKIFDLFQVNTILFEFNLPCFLDS